MKMPILRYFVFVGSALLLSLMLFDAPAEKQKTQPTAEIDRASIRIATARQKPELVLIDTSRPATMSVAPPPMQIVDSTAESEPGELSQTAKEAFAKMAVAPVKIAPKPKPHAPRTPRGEAMAFTSLAAPNTPW